MDVWAVCAVLPGSLRFVAKEELLKVPLFGPALRLAKHISIDRKNRISAVAAYQRGADDIRGGLAFSAGAWTGELHQLPSADEAVETAVKIARRNFSATEMSARSISSVRRSTR